MAIKWNGNKRSKKAAGLSAFEILAAYRNSPAERQFVHTQPGVLNQEQTFKEEMMEPFTISLIVGVASLTLAWTPTVSAATISHATSTVAANSSTATSTSSSVSGSNSFSAVSFTGNDGVHRVNEDRILVKDGFLSINGVPYGTVDKTSAIKYSVQGDKKTLTVDGIVRQPLQQK